VKQNKNKRALKQAIEIATAVAVCAAIGAGCASSQSKVVTPDQAAKLDRKLVRDAVIYEPGTEQGAVVPEISAPRLHAILVREHVENNRLIETHREWELDGDVTLLGIPKKKGDKEK
jgi:hypothetical protein